MGGGGGGVGAKTHKESQSIHAGVSTNLEIRDVHPGSFDAVFALLDLASRTSYLDISLALLARGFLEQEHRSIIDTLLWYGVLGAVDSAGAVTYIYDVQYNSHVLEQLRADRNQDSETFEINPAFRPALRVTSCAGGDSQITLI